MPFMAPMSAATSRCATSRARASSACLLEDKRSVALPVAGRDPRFLNRLGIYDRNLPFIAAPINVGGSLKGVLAVQPEEPDDGLLDGARRASSKWWPT